MIVVALVAYIVAYFIILMPKIYWFSFLFDRDNKCIQGVNVHGFLFSLIELVIAFKFHLLRVSFDA